MTGALDPAAAADLDASGCDERDCRIVTTWFRNREMLG